MCAVVTCSRNEDINNRLQEIVARKSEYEISSVLQNGHLIMSEELPRQTHLDRYARKNYESLLQQWLNTSSSASVDDWHSSLDATMATRVSFTVISEVK